MATSNPESLTLEQHEELVERKSQNKIDELPEGLSAERLKASMTAYKGKFTQAEKKAESNIITFEKNRAERVHGELAYHLVLGQR